MCGLVLLHLLDGAVVALQVVEGGEPLHFWATRSP